MAHEFAQMTMVYFRLQEPVLPRPSQEYDRDLIDPGEDVFAGLDLIDT
jgi:hypothetical protein